MRKFAFARNSIMVKLIRPMVAVLLIQVLLFAVAIFGGGTIERLSDSFFGVLDERVKGRKNYLENEFLNRWSNLTGFETYIQEQMNLSGFRDDPSLSSELLERITNNSVLTLRNHMATGVFVVLEGDGDQHEGIYFRDLEPSFNPTDNSDLLVERGSVDIVRSINASLDRRWAPMFTLSEGDPACDFYYKPFLAAKEFPTIMSKDLGYWSRPFRLSGDDVEVITYSMPLIDSDGNPWGVIGIDLTIDYLRTMLPYDEIAKEKQGSYLLGIGNEHNKVFENVISSGPMFKKLVGPNIQTLFEEEQKHYNMYQMRKSSRITKITYGNVQYLDLYNSNTPFEKDKWALIGIVEEKYLLEPTKQLQNSVLLCLLLSFIIGIVAIFIAGKRLIKPITLLVQKVRESNPDEPIILTRINITEIDELAKAVEYLSNNVADSASKLSQIVSMVNIPIGAFEYTLEGDRVLCTSTLFDVLGIKKEEKESKYICVDIFKKIIENIKKSPEPDLENIYRYNKNNNGTICWIRLQTQEQNGKILGVAEDVTTDTITKLRIEYERDHDILTHLLNRRAFHVSVKKKLQEDNIDCAAFIMWDLDNLKYINDTYGHDYGDQYIKMAASILNEFTVYNAIVARMSGDEFYTFIYGYKGKDEIRNIIAMMQKKMHHTRLTMPDQNTFRIRASAGIAWYPDNSNNYEELLKYSDFAMYEVKNTEKGNIGEFDKQSYDKDSFLLHGKEELNRFIDGELVKYAFQPIINAKTGKIFAYEALMRPQIESLNSPLDILKLAQSQSKLYEIERITWFKAMDAFTKHKKAFGDSKIFINSIPNHVLSDKDQKRFEDNYKQYLNDVVIEIIENEQSNKQCTKKKQEMVARWNSQLALDDFGSGYNSETALLILSPSFVKIDMTIIRGIDKDLNRQKLLQNLLSYAQGRQIKIIAEGIETKNEMDTLIGFGVDYMQGFYLGKPEMTPQKISRKLVEEIRIENERKLN